MGTDPVCIEFKFRYTPGLIFHSFGDYYPTATCDLEEQSTITRKRKWLNLTRAHVGLVSIFSKLVDFGINIGKQIAVCFTSVGV